MVNNDKILGSRSYLATGINLEFSKENDVTNFIGRRIDTYNRTDAIAISTVIKGFKKDSLLVFAKNVVHSSLRSGNNFEKILYIISNQEEYQMHLIDSDSFDEKKDRYYKNVRISDELIGLLIDCLKKCSNCLYSNYITSSTLISNKLKSNKPFYHNNVYITTMNGKKVGVYIDEKNDKHIVSNICPHLKCNLIFNNFDKTWDCPCHGSRFDIDGNIIQGPSVYNIKINDN